MPKTLAEIHLSSPDVKAEPSGDPKPEGAEVTPSPSSETPPSGEEVLKAQVKELRQKVTELGEANKSLSGNFATLREYPEAAKLMGWLETGQLPTEVVEEGPSKADLVKAALVEGDETALEALLKLTQDETLAAVDSRLSPVLQERVQDQHEAQIDVFFKENKVGDDLREQGSAFWEYAAEVAVGEPHLDDLFKAQPKVALEILYTRYVKKHGDAAADKKAQADLDAKKAASLGSAPSASGSLVKMAKDDKNPLSFREIYERSKLNDE